MLLDSIINLFRPINRDISNGMDSYLSSSVIRLPRINTRQSRLRVTVSKWKANIRATTARWSHTSSSPFLLGTVALLPELSSLAECS